MGDTTHTEKRIKFNPFAPCCYVCGKPAYVATSHNGAHEIRGYCRRHA